MNEDKRYAIHVDVTMLDQNYLCIGKTMSLYFRTMWEILIKKDILKLAFILTLQCSLTVAIAPFWPDSAYLKFVASRYLCPWLSCVESATKGFNSFDEGLYRWNMYFSANRNLQLLEISPISHGCLFSMAVTV